MDIADDWDQGYNANLYVETYDAVIRFAKKYPDTLWCYGNHELSYIWHEIESGYSYVAAVRVQKKIRELKTALPENNPIKYVQRIDNVLFSHGGVCDQFVRDYVSSSKYNDIDATLDIINSLGMTDMWDDDSPIWLRPQYSDIKMYKPRKMLQVVDHTPVEKIWKKGNTISCDVFSTYRDGRPIGTEGFLLLDTLTWEYQGVRL